MPPRNIPTNPEHDKLVKLTMSSVRRLLALAKPYRRQLIVAAFIMLLTSAVNLAMPVFGRAGLDRVVKTGSASALDHYAFIILGLVVIAASLIFTQSMLVAFVGNSIVRDLRHRLFAHLEILPVVYFDKTRSGDLTSHLSNDVGQVQQTLASDLAGLVSNLVSLVGGIALAIIFDWQLCLVVVGLLGMVMTFFVVFGRKLRRLTREMLDALSDTMGAMTEALANIRLVKAFAREPFEADRAQTKLDRVYGLAMRTSIAESAMGTVAFAGFTLLLLGVVWYGGREVMSGRLTLGTLLGFFMIVPIISGPMGTLASLYTRLQRAVGAADRLFAILDEKPEPLDSPAAESFPARTDVEFRRVEFAYVADVPVLTGLNLNLPAGKVTAIVGHSGSGKTTLASLLYRFYEPQGGEIAIGGVPISALRRAELRGHIGLVPQDTILFNATIRENIRYGRLDASDDAVAVAARAANVEEFVASFPDGYETMIGERGITLSGGQRQRVAIARVLLKDPKILILDEATSALDARSEALVREALERAMEGRTTMVIAHRLSTIQNADQIAVIDDGRIVETGTHSELLTRAGRYAELQNLAREAGELESPLP